MTIVFFSRTYFEANSIEDFPVSMRGAVQRLANGRYFEDYYRVAVQNERYSDWMPVLIYLRKLFNLYEKEVVNYHLKKHPNGPKGYNSSASQGNFLEVLNMSLNVFERHNLDRSFDRTGQLSVVISPGVGVYEVDLTLTNITKQRIIDNGIGSDLVCLGEQPLHAVPLFKFVSNSEKLSDCYNMPHWINLSFYCSKRRFTSNFIPRLKVPINLQLKPRQNSNQTPPSKDKNILCSTNNNAPENNLADYPNIDFDQFDQQVFRIPRDKIETVTNEKKKFHSIAALNQKLTELKRKQNGETIETKPKIERIEEIHIKEAVLSASYTAPSMSPANKSFLGEGGNDAVDGMAMSTGRCSKDNSTILATSVDSKTGNKTLKEYRSKAPSKAEKDKHDEVVSTKTLINPFDPAHVAIKLNSNRRRWTHVFPLGPTGIFMQQHHYQAIPHNTACSMVPFSFIEYPPDNLRNLSLDQLDAVKKRISESSDGGKEHQRFYRLSARSTRIPSKDPLTIDNTSVWAFGATGEQEWTPAMTTGVDWKSLVMPACLPITTDFMPDINALKNDFFHYTYDLIPDDKSYEMLISNEKHAMKMFDQVLNEILYQRLQQGFQIIIVPNEVMKQLLDQKLDVLHTYMLSIGRVYHHVIMWDLKITIISYHPKQLTFTGSISKYRYRIRTPDNETYGVSWANFTTERLETYKWNYLDNYICVQGDGDYSLIESLKFWRFRLLVLPTMHSITKRIIDNYREGKNDFSCDLYLPLTSKEKVDLQNYFIQLIETINSKRQQNKSGTMNPAAGSDSKYCRLSLISEYSIGEKSPHNSAEDVKCGEHLPITSLHMELFERFKKE